MKHLNIISMAILLFLISTETTLAKKINALFSYKAFCTNKGEPFIETYLSVNGSSIEYVKNNSGKWQGSVEVMILVKDENGKMHFGDKYNLLSPEVDDLSKTSFNFLDQKRISLINGNYNLDLSIRDKNATDEQPFKATVTVNISFLSGSISFSDIELVDSYSKDASNGNSATSKSGYEIIPFADNYYGSSLSSIKFYAELYNTDKVLGTDPFLITYQIRNYENKQPVEQLKGFSKRIPEPVIVILSEFPISNLPSGNYEIVVEARNRQNELLAFRECYFQRNSGKTAEAEVDFSNLMNIDVSQTFAASITGKDSLAEIIKSLRPISNANETTFGGNQLKLADVKMMQQFLFSFWYKRNPENPEAAWIAYNNEVQKVNKSFSTLSKKGYETERGRVYLQYGEPNLMQKEYNEPSAYPYEIWQYYRVGSQTNRKFVFYNPDLVTNDFELLHSDVRGEPSDEQWQARIHQRNVQVDDIGRQQQIDPHGAFGNKVKSNFDNPR